MPSKKQYNKSKKNKKKENEEPFDLNQSLKNYAKYDDYISTYQPKIKSVEKLRNQERKKIIKYASTNNIQKKQYNVSSSTFSLFTEEKMSPFNQKFVKTSLEKYFIQKYPHMDTRKCAQIADNIMTFMLNQRTKNKQLKFERMVSEKK